MLTTLMVLIHAGSYVPLYTSENTQKPLTVQAFYMDEHPVTHQAFLSFVTEHPTWRKSNILPLFADEAYLKLWESDLRLGSQAPPNHPVTHVSWFAAKAYCQAKGQRLPIGDEWEYVAQASETKKNGTEDPTFLGRILSWYSQPTSYSLRDVGTGFKNVWGIYDIHGLIWEWILDFNSFLVTGESRADKSLEQKLYCGAGALNATDVTHYAAFMRYAFRSSLQATFCIANLGFRCAKNATPQE